MPCIFECLALSQPSPPLLGGGGVVSLVVAPPRLLVLAPVAMGNGVALLSDYFISVAPLHAQILASEEIVTFFELVDFSESITIGNALAPWPIRLTTVVVGLVRVPPIFLQLWLNFIFF